MPHFHLLTVSRKREETGDAISISFRIPEELKEAYRYKQGQYLTLKATINGESVRRAYSLCSSPVTGEDPTVTVKRVDGGKMSNYLNDVVKEGMQLEVMQPEGRFYTELSPAHKKQYILVGGGSGITPLISIIKTVLQTEPASKCSLIYGNRNSRSIIFRQELDTLVQQSGGRLDVTYLLDEAEAGWTGETGMLTADKAAALIRKVQSDITDREYFLCGPGGLMDQVKLAFQQLSLPQDKIHIEFFTAPVSDEKKEETVVQNLDFEGSKVTVILNKKEYEIHIKDNATVLQAALKAGIDAPFSCEAGICSTCMAKVLEGSVRMDENNILTADEVKKGYVLTCQSHPTSKVVRLEYYD